jgi:epoxyqueuosine reductase QueG
MESLIRGTIAGAVAGHQGRITYRAPLVGFTTASDPGFAELREAVGPGHLLPQDMLTGAQTVVAFFVPFDSGLVSLQREDPEVNRAWAEAYVETNLLIESVCGALGDALAGKGVRAVWQLPTHNFDRKTLLSVWSHKHVAYLCGLGSFGRHQMLITAAGCAGRLGSLVIDAALPEATGVFRSAEAPPGSKDAGEMSAAATAGAGVEFCLARRGGRCDTCIRRCPSGALTEQGLDKQRCLRQLIQVNKQFPDLSNCLVCGKCATGPCALSVPRPE